MSNANATPTAARPQPVQRLAVSPLEAAEMLGCSRQFVYDLIARGELPSSKLGGARRIRVTDLEALLAGGTSGRR